tara:strand:- start:988 stop:1353 length:366 start_codon:yes stop_codon:yes gene_type:complete
VKHRGATNIHATRRAAEHYDAPPETVKGVGNMLRAHLRNRRRKHFNKGRRSSGGIADMDGIVCLGNPRSQRCPWRVMFEGVDYTVIYDKTTRQVVTFYPPGAQPSTKASQGGLGRRRIADA